MGRAAVEGWISLDAGKKLLQMAGQDFDALKKQAATREFKPVPLGVTASMTIHNTLRTIDSQNVVARLEGGDPALKDEYVVYTAHWDHLGKGRPKAISTTARSTTRPARRRSLEMARAFTRLPPPPKRSILFLSVTAEEQGLLGSQYYSVTPIYPLAKTLAEHQHGRAERPRPHEGPDARRAMVRRISTTTRVQAAGEQGRIVHADAEPEKGFYYRSDHFNFAKQGVPALDPDDGVDYVGKPADYGQKLRDDCTATSLSHSRRTSSGQTGT